MSSPARLTIPSASQVFLIGFFTVPLLILWASAGDVVTYHNDSSRTGQYLDETILTTSNVNSANFGKLFTMPLDGVMDAQPLYLAGVTISGVTHNVIYAVTENDSVYAFDADSGAQLWTVSVLEAGESPSDTRGCSQITPEIGIPDTPVIDRSAGANGTIYLVAMSKTSTKYFQRLHALDLTTGAEQFSGPITIQAKYPGNGDNSHNGNVIFDPKQYAERAGLLLLNGVIYTAWTSHCDIRPYTGWIIGYDQNTLAQTSVLNVTPNGNEGAVWQAGGGLASDGKGIYFLDANGTFDTTLNSGGFPINGDYGNAIVRLGVNSGNKLKVVDYFNMFNTVSESNADEDLGSGGILLLPGMQDSTGKNRFLAAGAGKDGNIYLVDRTNLGKFNSSSNLIYQEVDGVLGGGLWSMPAYFNGNLYYGPQTNNLMQFQFTQARLSTSAVSKSATTFTYPGTTPAVSANGTANGIVWAIEHTGTSVLHAYDATNLANELYNSNQAAGGRDKFGSASHFGTPIISNGKVYVGTTNTVVAFGLLH
jgi:hypothetical protein